jgi:calcineurin-like phosphoesterase family protein
VKIWFLSDLHLFHANMLRGGKIGIRPFDTVHEMHERIIEGWNSVVRPNDKVYMQGDLTLHRPKKKGVQDPMLDALERILMRLPGQKRILLGNHDHLDVAIYQWLGFEKVLAYREMAGILFSHIPVHPSQFYRFRGNVHGHTHESFVNLSTARHAATLAELTTPKRDLRYINVCVEPRNYIPMSLDEIVAYYEKMEKW